MKSAKKQKSTSNGLSRTRFPAIVAKFLNDGRTGPNGFVRPFVPATECIVSVRRTSKKAGNQEGP